MKTKPVDIGTAAETAVVRYVAMRGFPMADRIPKGGAAPGSPTKDRADVWLAPGLVVQVKAGHAAEQASDLKIHDWLADTEMQRVAARAEVAFLVTKRAGYAGPRAGSWWAHMTNLTYERMRGADDLIRPLPHPLALRVTFDDALLLARAGGWGAPYVPAGDLWPDL